MPSEDIVSAYWTTRPWCCVVASIHAPPRYRLGALPNELTQRFIWCPCEESNPALPLTRRPHRRQCFKGDASRRNQTSVSSLRGTCSVTELCRHAISGKLTNGRAFCFASRDGRQVHNAASNSFGRSRCQTTRSSRIAFLSLRQSSAVPRAPPHAVEPATRTMRAHVMRAARTSSRLRWCFLRYSGPFLPSCLFGGGFFGPAAG